MSILASLCINIEAFHIIEDVQQLTMFVHQSHIVCHSFNSVRVNIFLSENKMYQSTFTICISVPAYELFPKHCTTVTIISLLLKYLHSKYVNMHNENVCRAIERYRVEAVLNQLSSHRKLYCFRINCVNSEGTNQNDVHHVSARILLLSGYIFFGCLWDMGNEK